jgi:hypothetical protein
MSLLQSHTELIIKLQTADQHSAYIIMRTQIVLTKLMFRNTFRSISSWNTHTRTTQFLQHYESEWLRMDMEIGVIFG